MLPSHSRTSLSPNHRTSHTGSKPKMLLNSLAVTVIFLIPGESLPPSSDLSHSLSPQISSPVSAVTPTTPAPTLPEVWRPVTRAGSAPPPGSCSARRGSSGRRCPATASPGRRTGPPGAPSGRGATRSGPAGTRGGWRCTPASVRTISAMTTPSSCPSSTSGSQ